MDRPTVHWNMNWIEGEIGDKVINDTAALQVIFDRLEAIDIGGAESASANTCFENPVFVTDDGKAMFTGWREVLPALRTKWQNADSPPLSVQNPHVTAEYLPYDKIKKPPPEEDKDIKIDVKITLPFSDIHATFFHRRICTFG